MYYSHVQKHRIMGTKLFTDPHQDKTNKDGRFGFDSYLKFKSQPDNRKRNIMLNLAWRKGNKEDMKHRKTLGRISQNRCC